MRKVEYLRRKRGLRQYVLARSLGINPSTLNRFEQGLLNPDLMSQRVRTALETFFGLSIHDLLEEV